MCRQIPQTCKWTSNKETSWVRLCDDTCLCMPVCVCVHECMKERACTNLCSYVCMCICNSAFMQVCINSYLSISTVQIIHVLCCFRKIGKCDYCESKMESAPVKLPCSHNMCSSCWRLADNIKKCPQCEENIPGDWRHGDNTDRLCFCLCQQLLQWI